MISLAFVVLLFLMGFHSCYRLCYITRFIVGRFNFAGYHQLLLKSPRGAILALYFIDNSHGGSVEVNA